MNELVKVIAATFAVELGDIGKRGGGDFIMMVVMMPHAVLAKSRGITKTAGQIMVDSAIMELDIPTDRYE